jgi:hypothetical protein
MDARERKGILIAQRGDVAEDDRSYLVRSESKPGHEYRVYFALKPVCGCDDFDRHGGYCKHIWAVHYAVIVESGGELPEVPDEEEVERETASRNWPAYHRAQVHEKRKLLLLLHDLCSGLTTPPPSRQGGRPRLPLSDIVFALVYKVYSKQAARQFTEDLQTAKENGLVTTAVHYNSLLNYLGDASLTPVLTALVEESAAPLSALERGDFAVDATGITVYRYRRWMVEREATEKEKRDWVKLNLICGVKTKVVAAVKVGDGVSNESPHLPGLIARTAKNFRVLRVMADGGYQSADNYAAIDEIGAVPFIPFEEGNRAGTGLWARMYHFYHFRHAEFMRHFNKRSLVECVFSMIKKRFGEAVLARSDVAMKNEVLCKVICHNLCRVIHAMFDSGLEPEFHR